MPKAVATSESKPTSSSSGSSAGAAGTGGAGSKSYIIAYNTLTAKICRLTLYSAFSPQWQRIVLKCGASLRDCLRRSRLYCPSIRTVRSGIA
jgi:hypothetical protein